jgi:putative hydrolase of the HAD superfamily
MAACIPPAARAVFFDAVGTLLFPDPPAVMVYADAARRAGVELAPAEIRTRFTEAFAAEERADRDAGWVTSEQREHHRWRTIVGACLREVRDADACFAGLFEHFARPTAWQLHTDAATVISQLSARGLVLGMGSNYDSRLWSVLGGFPELNPLRDRVTISAAVGFRKPAREFFAEVVRVAGCPPGEVLFVGDDFGNDYEGATAAGLGAVLLDGRTQRPDVPNRIIRLAELTE